MKTLIKGAVVVPMTEGGQGAGGTGSGAGETWFVGSVAWEGNKIVYVGPDGGGGAEGGVDEFIAANPDAEVIDGRGRLVMPGLVNTHTHVAMTLMRNAMDDVPLMKWLNEKIWPLEATLTPDDIARGARVGIEEMLAGGTTTMVDMYWHEAAIAKVVKEEGIRAVLCPCFVDGEKMADFEADLPETLAVAEEAGGRITVRIGPHAAYTCSPETMRRGIELARKHGLGAHVHLSETQDEQAIVKERYGCTPTEYLRDQGLFELPTMAAHSIHLSDGDIEILRGAGVTAVHNPQSNMKLASGAAPVVKLLEAGVNVSLGTDGAASNNDLDMFDEMRTAALLAKHTAADPSVLPAWEVLRMATANGAEAIGMGGELGVLAQGALADVVMVDVTGPHWFPAENDPVSALVYSAKSSDVCGVWVDGEARLRKF